jgi:uncharacterized membrane protein
MTPNPSNRAQTEDWVMVKREPDAAMLAAADRVGNQFAGSDLSSDEMTRAVWAAMLSAAPTISPRGSEDRETALREALDAYDTASAIARMTETRDAVRKQVEARTRLFALASLSPRGRGPVDMLVDGDWLRRKVETDPDIDTEAGPSLAAPRGRGEGLEWLERIHNALMTPSMPRQSIGEMAAAGIAALSSAPVSGGGEGKQGLMADPSEHDLVCGDAREGARAAPGEEGQS